MKNKEMKTVANDKEKSATPSLPTRDPRRGPTFDPSQVTVIFVLGGPGVGKGTQCDRLCKEAPQLGFTHLSAGDLLRAERSRPGSPYGSLIDELIREGQIVPFPITIGLLEAAMLGTHGPANRRFLIDGFPRDLEQAEAFERHVCPGRAVLLLECQEEALMMDRILQRGRTSGRADDNRESLMKRFRTFRNSTLPVLEAYGSKGKVWRVPADLSIEEVGKHTRSAIDEILLADEGWQVNGCMKKSVSNVPCMNSNLV